MSDLASELHREPTTGTTRAGATLAQLRERRQVVGDAYIDQSLLQTDPLEIVIRAPSQTEWWVRVRKGHYEQARTVSAAEPFFRGGA